MAQPPDSDGLFDGLLRGTGSPLFTPFKIADTATIFYAMVPDIEVQRILKEAIFFLQSAIL